MSLIGSARLRLRSRFCREAAASLLSALIYAASQWLLLKILFRYMGTGMAGWYAYAMAIISPITSFASFGLRSVLVTDSSREFAFADYFTFRLGASGLGIIVCALAYWGFSRDPLLHEMMVPFLWLAVYRGIEWLSDIAQGEYQRQGRMGTVLTAFSLKLCTGLAGFAAIALLLHRVDFGLAWLALCSAAVLFLYELPAFRLRQSVALVYRASALKKIGLVSLPLGTVLLITALQASIPRYLLEKHTSLEAVGVFAGLSYFSVLGGFLSSAITNALSPILSEHRANLRWRSFGKALTGVLLGDLLIALVLWIVFWCAGSWLLRMMFSAQVAAYAHYLPLVALLAVVTFWDAHLGCAVTALRRFKSALVVQSGRLLLITPLAAFLIARWNIPGAIWASIAFPLSSILAFTFVVVRDVCSAARTSVHQQAETPIPQRPVAAS
jgi:O-antigen/teichoic acid export membrane protein